MSSHEAIPSASTGASQRIEIITGHERRRHYTDDDKAQLLGRPLGRGRASSLSHAVMESPRAFCIGGAGPSSALRNERGPRPG